MEEIRHEVMVNYLFQQQTANVWLGDDVGRSEGVLVRKTRSEYLACPPELLSTTFATGCIALNVPCALTINSRVIKTLLAWSPDAMDVPLRNGQRVQILRSLIDLPRARKAQCAAFIAANGLLVVWDDGEFPLKGRFLLAVLTSNLPDTTNLVARGKAIESEIMDLVWNTKDVEAEEVVELDDDNEKKPPRVVALEVDEESGEEVHAERKTHMLNAILVALTLFLIAVMLGAGFRQIAIEISVDHNWIRLAFLALTPVQIFFTLVRFLKWWCTRGSLTAGIQFFAQVIVGCLAQCFGPVKQMKENSRFYSAMLPARLKTHQLPHVTVQCPVYKEGLESVIAPTIKSIKQAISTYELQGGSANMFVNDDGLQIIPEEEKKARIDFYSDNGIGWTARPKHNSEGFVRRGKFKKVGCDLVQIFMNEAHPF